MRSIGSVCLFITICIFCLGCQYKPKGVAEQTPQLKSEFGFSASYSKEYLTQHPLYEDTFYKLSGNYGRIQDVHLLDSTKVVILGSQSIGEFDFNQKIEKTILQTNEKFTYVTSSLLPKQQLLIIEAGIKDTEPSFYSLFDIPKSRYIKVPSMIIPRLGFATVPLKSGDVLLIGGKANHNLLNSIELYRYKENSFSMLSVKIAPKVAQQAKAIDDNQIAIYGEAPFRDDKSLAGKTGSIIEILNLDGLKVITLPLKPASRVVKLVPIEGKNLFLLSSIPQTYNILTNESKPVKGKPYCTKIPSLPTMPGDRPVVSANSGSAKPIPGIGSNPSIIQHGRVLLFSGGTQGITSSYSCDSINILSLDTNELYTGGKINSKDPYGHFILIKDKVFRITSENIYELKRGGR